LLSLNKNELGSLAPLLLNRLDSHFILNQTNGCLFGCHITGEVSPVFCPFSDDLLFGGVLYIILIFMLLISPIMKRLLSILVLIFGFTASAQVDSTVKSLEIEVPTVDAPTYQLFPTENPWALLKLNTVNGIVSQLHYTISDNFEGELSLNSYSLLYDREEIIGRFTLYPTQNLYNFILLDQIDGRTWKVQWNNDSDKRFMRRIY